MKLGYARVPYGKSHQDFDIDRLASSVDEVYIDFGVAFENLIKLKKLVKQKKVDEVKILAPFCLGVSVHKVFSNLEYLKKYSKVVFADRGYGYITQEETVELSAQLAKEVRTSAQQTARDNNKHGSRPLFGWVNIDGKLQESMRLVPGTEYTEWQVARMFIDMYLQPDAAGLRITYYNFEQKYGFKFPMSAESLFSWIKKPALLGHTFYYNGEKYYHTHKALVTEEEFESIQKKLRMNRRNLSQERKTSGVPYPLESKVKCALCGAACHRAMISAKNPYGRMVCNARGHDTTSCDNVRSTPLHVIEEEAILAVCQRLAKYCTAKHEIQKESDEIVDGDPAIKQLRHQLGSLHLLKEEVKKRGADECGLEILDKAIIETEIRINFQIRISHVDIKANKVLDYLVENHEQIMHNPPYTAPFNIRWWHALDEKTRIEYLDALVEKVLVQNENVEEVVLKF